MAISLSVGTQCPGLGKLINEDNDPIYSNKWREEVSNALALAGLPVNGAFKNDLGLELDTRVGEGGRTLSGGQRQVRLKLT